MKKNTKTDSYRNWLDDLGGTDNWMGGYCKDYLARNQDLPSHNNLVEVMDEMTSKQRVVIESRLEQEVADNRSAAYVYIGWAHAVGALKAFRKLLPERLKE